MKDNITMMDCSDCYWFCYKECKCNNKNRKNDQRDKVCELFKPALLFKNDCTNCTHSHRVFEETPEGVIIPESMFHICDITGEEYSDYDLPSTRTCSDFELKQFVKYGRVQYFVQDFLRKLEGWEK